MLVPQWKSRIQRFGWWVVLIAALFSVASLSADSAGSEEKPREIQITARRFSFDPAEITLKKGEPVVLVFRSLDVTHGFIIPDLKVRTEIHKGRTSRVALQPNEVGTFEARCSYFCGVGHGSMRLFIHVVE